MSVYSDEILYENSIDSSLKNLKFKLPNDHPLKESGRIKIESNLKKHYLIFDLVRKSYYIDPADERNEGPYIFGPA